MKRRGVLSGLVCVFSLTAGCVAVLDSDARGTTTRDPGTTTGETDTTQAPRSTWEPETVTRPSNWTTTSYEYDFGGQLQATPVDATDDKWPTVAYVDRLHERVRSVVREVARTGEEVPYEEIEPDTKAEIKANLHNEFGVSGDRFYVAYEGEPIRVTVIHDT